MEFLQDFLFQLLPLSALIKSIQLIFRYQLSYLFFRPLCHILLRRRTIAGAGIEPAPPATNTGVLAFRTLLLHYSTITLSLFRKENYLVPVHIRASIMIFLSIIGNNPFAIFALLALRYLFISFSFVPGVTRTPFLCRTVLPFLELVIIFTACVFTCN